jgi:hypothetical protein
MVKDLRSFLPALAPFSAVADADADADAFRWALMQAQASNVESFNVRTVFNNGGDILLARAHVASVAVKIASIRSVSDRGCTIDRKMKKMKFEDESLRQTEEAQGYRCHGSMDVEAMSSTTNQYG